MFEVLWFVASERFVSQVPFAADPEKPTRMHDVPQHPARQIGQTPTFGALRA